MQNIWLNYHHLLYFWTVARTGSITDAATELMLAAPTISGQLRQLENSLKARLLRRKGRNLVLTEMGQLVYRYADEIFSLGREMVAAVQDRPADRPLRLTVGVDESVPKLVARDLLRPAMQMGAPIHLVCREGPPQALLADLVAYRLDLILSDHPMRSDAHVKVFSHPLGECGITFLAAPALAAALREGFPRSLHHAPALLPTAHTTLRRTLDRWFQAQDLRPHILAEFDDSALAKTFGSDGMGFFAVPSVIAADTALRYHVEPVGQITDHAERFYAISIERRLKHPAVVAITEAARTSLFRG